MSELLVREQGLLIATEAFGDPAHAPVLLIMGGGASMLWWPEEFCARLAGRGRYVIRFDQRDTGRSTKVVAGDPPYTLDDLVADAVRVLDAYAIPAAHLVGMSLGGIIGQLVALHHSTRVRSLTAMSSSPFGVDTSRLPPSSEAYRGHLATAENVDWSDREQVIDVLARRITPDCGDRAPVRGGGDQGVLRTGLRPVRWLFDISELRVAGRRCVAGPAARDEGATAGHSRHGRSGLPDRARGGAGGRGRRREAGPPRRGRPRVAPGRLELDHRRDRGAHRSGSMKPVPVTPLPVEKRADGHIDAEARLKSSI